MTKIYAQDRGERAFHDWHQNSAVRSRPYAYLLTPQDLADTDPERWYPTSLNPVLSLSEVTKLPSSTRLNAHVAHLVHFLDYTTTLELTVVNDAVASMTLGALKQNFDAVDQRAALKLYTDEGYHALFSRQIADQLVEHFDIARHPAMRLLLLNQYIEQTPSTYKSLAVFMIAFVSETIITRELLDLSREQLVEPVFHMLRDHLHDEARHSVFFLIVFANYCHSCREPRRRSWLVR
ncbi:diiron oxygenase [Pseudomonas sp. I2]|uniref:diiron oxygenase n=1 Tax=Pseudomonas sp. I2 TaxID=1338438 RepID=UPI0034D4B120